MEMSNQSLPLQHDLMHKFVIDRLKKMHVTKSQSGKLVDDLDYDEAKYELVLASFREVDTESPERQWF